MSIEQPFGEGSAKQGSALATPAGGDDRMRVLAVLEKTALKARQRLEYEKVISTLAARFIAPDHQERAIDLALKEIARFTTADRAFLCLFDDKLEKIEEVRGWKTDGAEGPLALENELPLSDFPELIMRLKQGEAVRISDTSKGEGKRRDELERLAEAGVASLLMMPIKSHDQIRGVIGLCCPVRPREWAEEDLSLLLVAGSMLSSALQRQAAHEAMKASENKYRSLIENAGDAIFMTDAETGRILEVNHEGEVLLGRPASEIIGMHHSDLHAPAEAEEASARFREYAAAEIPPPAKSERFVVNANGDHIPVQICASIIDLGDRRIVQGVFRDDTARHEARELRESLNKINSVINSTLNFDTVLELVTIEAAAALEVDTAAALLPDADEWVIHSVHHYEPELIGARFTKEQLTHITVANRKRHPVAFNDALNDDRIDRRTMETFGIKSVLVVPLLVRDDPIGCLTFCQHKEAKDFTDAQIHFATQLATATSFALENARLYAEKRNIADALQQSLLTMPKELTGVHYGNLYRSATRTTQVGGDFYDIFELPGDRVGILIGDVSGKGLEAAKLTSAVKHTIRAYAAEGHSPNEVLRKTNTLTLQMTEPSTFVTVFFGTLDKSSGKLDYCSAGHPPGIVKTRDGRARPLTVDSPALGILPTLEFKGDEVTLAKGEVLFVYTDGATDARRDGELFGEERLKQLVGTIKSQTTEELPHRVISELLDFASAGLSDDLAMLSVSLA